MFTPPSGCGNYDPGKLQSSDDTSTWRHIFILGGGRLGVWLDR